jgi:hypothetical protein
MLADRQIAALVDQLAYSTPPGQELQDRYRGSEIIRVLISSAVALRILFDQHPHAFDTLPHEPCGKLWPRWPEQKGISELLTRGTCSAGFTLSGTGEPDNQCRPEPTPFALSIQLGMQIIQQKDEVILLYLSDHQVRHVTDGAFPVPEDLAIGAVSSAHVTCDDPWGRRGRGFGSQCIRNPTYNPALGPVGERAGLSVRPEHVRHKSHKHTADR